jgi:hypothetical protein
MKNNSSNLQSRLDIQNFLSTYQDTNHTHIIARQTRLIFQLHKEIRCLRRRLKKLSSQQAAKSVVGDVMP